MSWGELFRNVTGIFRWWVIVAPWEQAVRVRAGKRVDVLGAGFHLRIPLIDRVFRQSTRRRFITVPTQTVSTSDGKAVTVSGGIGYAICDIGRLYDTLHHPEDVIQTEAQGAIARFIAARTLEACGPRAIEEHVTGRMDLTRYGLSTADFYITDFVAVRTYRLIQGEPRNWMSGDSLSTTLEDSKAAS